VGVADWLPEGGVPLSGEKELVGAAGGSEGSDLSRREELPAAFWRWAALWADFFFLLAIKA
jgi:hypothetical protein